MIRTQVNLTDEQYRKLKAEARSKSKSVSALIRDSVDKRLTRSGSAGILLEMARRAGKSGEKNLARDYKRYLYGDKSKYAK